MGLFTSRLENVKAATAAGVEQHHEEMGDFHSREAAKYEAKALEREARGDHKGAARSRKVAERNRRKAAEHKS
jgi:hypothetical protein